MFKKFLVESFRAKQTRPLSFIINWLGLTFGFAAVIVMYIFIMDQVRHDACFERPMDDVARCELEIDQIGSGCPDPLARFMTTRFPEVVAATRVSSWGATTVSVADRPGAEHFSLRNMLGDSALLQVFPFRMVAGSGADALADGTSGLLSRSAAMRLFGTTDAVGRRVELNNEIPMTVTGIFEDVPENSLYTPEIILPFRLMMPGDKADRWNSWMSECYFRVVPGTDLTSFNLKFQRTLLEFFREMNSDSEDGKTVDDFIAEKGGPESPALPHIRAFNDCYFTPEVMAFGNAYDPSSLVVLGIIAALVLVIAVINYVNIYTARSTEVIRSMGIKSIMGATRRSLVGFIIGDSVLITFVSALTAFGLAYALQPLYPVLFGSELSFSLSWDVLLVLFVGMPLVCGVLSGIFPAVMLTRTKPLDAIANRSSGGRQMSAVRNALIVFQFTVSIGLIASTLLINKQIRYLTTLDLGYNRENVVKLWCGPYMNRDKFNTFRTQLLTHPAIVDASLINGNPMAVGNMNTVPINEQENFTPRYLAGDPHTLHVLGIPMVEGDSISETNIDRLKWGQYDCMLINEAFAKHIRTVAPEVQIPGSRFIGVFRDFQHQPLTERISPLALVPAWSGDPYIRIAAGQIEPALRHIESTFREMFPNEIYDYTFMDALFDRMYRLENQFRARLLTFSVLAIFIGCLGLFALVGYSVERRRKEIAIRKVHGATVREVVGMLCASFLRWLAISFVVAVPAVWWLMDGWMSRYAYRTEMSWWIFAAAGVIAAVIALFTVLGQSYRAAVENPARAVKGE